MFQIRLCSVLFRLFVFMIYWTEADAVAQRCSVKRFFLEISQNLATGFRSQTCNFIKIETLAQLLSCGFCEIFKNTFSYKTPLVAASAEVYSEPCQRFKMELFAKIVSDCKSINFFHKSFILRCLTGLWIRLCRIQGKLLAHVFYMLKYITCLK